MGEVHGPSHAPQGIAVIHKDHDTPPDESTSASPSARAQDNSPSLDVRPVDVPPDSGLRPDEQLIVAHGEHYIVSLNDPDDPHSCMIEHASPIPLASPSPLSPLSPASSDPNTPSSPTADSKKRSIRFRSRVRIASGVRRHFVLPDTPPAAFRARSPSSSSTISDSSSITAPLRWRDGEKSLRDRPGWGTLGQRVSLLAGGSGRRQQRQGDEGEGEGAGRPPTVHEGTPLMQSAIPTRRYIYADDSEDNEDDEDRLRREIDLVFGKWPGRLLNSNWWWWQLEPIVCCHCICIDDSDIED